MKLDLSIETTPAGTVTDPEGLMAATVTYNGKYVNLSQHGYETMTVAELCRLLEFKVRASS